MSHFYGTLKGNRGEATRCGAKSSGLETIAASWRGAVRTSLYHDDVIDVDMALVELTKWHGVGGYRELYRGPVNPSDQGLIDAHAAKMKDQENPLTADKPPKVEMPGPVEDGDDEPESNAENGYIVRDANGRPDFIARQIRLSAEDGEKEAAHRRLGDLDSYDPANKRTARRVPLDDRARANQELCK